MSRREEEGGEQKGRRSKTRQKTYNKLNILRGVVRGVPFRGVAWKNVTKTLRGAVLCNPERVGNGYTIYGQGGYKTNKKCISPVHL